MGAGASGAAGVRHPVTASGAPHAVLVSSSAVHQDPPASVTVHSSWRGLVAAGASPALLVGLGSLVLAAGGLNPVGIGLVGVGVVLGAVSLLDFPRRSVFTRAGIDRVCLLRTQHLAWDDVVAIERTPPSARQRYQPRLFGERDQPRQATGGLVARGAGRRRYLLTDRIESRREYEDIVRLVADVEAPAVVRAPTPADETPPTDLYRRSRREGGPS